MKSRPGQTVRRGVTLVELMVVMSSAVVVLSMSTVLIHRIMHVQSKSQDFFRAERSAIRLRAQFRSDVHAATSASIEVPDENPRLTLTLFDDQTILYEHADGKVSRLLLSGGSVKAREEFKFPAASEWMVLERTDPNRVMISLESQAPERAARNKSGPAPAFATPIFLQIEACLGRDWPPSATAAKPEISK